MSLIDTLARIPKILEANLNDLLNKAEDPRKMIDQLLIDYKKDLADVKRDTKEVMADYEIAEKNVRDCAASIAELENAAKNAVKAGDVDAARDLIAQKQKKEAVLADLKKTLEVRKQNADIMKEGYNKLVANIADLEARRDSAKAKISQAEALEKQSKLSGVGKTDKVLDSFARYEAEADRRLARANAGVELDSKTSSVDDLLKKYGGAGNSTSVDEELARLQAELNG